MQLKFLEVFFMPAVIYGTKAWRYIKKEEMKEIESIQGKTLKKIFKLPVSTLYTERNRNMTCRTKNTIRNNHVAS